MKAWLFAGAIAALMTLVAVGTARSGLMLRTWIPGYNLLLNLPDNLLRVLLVLLCIAIGVVLGPGPRALGWDISALPGYISIGLLSGFALTAGISVLGWAAMRRWGAGIYSNKMLQCILPISRREWFGVLFALLPAAALEELLFRSLPLAGLAWLIPPWWLLWPLSLFFGALHWPQGWWGVVGTTLAAVVLSLLFLASGSIWVPLTAHYVMNVAQLVLAKWSGVRPLRASL